MINLVLYQHLNDLKAEFDEKNLIQLPLIVPSPRDADRIRELIPNVNTKTLPDFQKELLNLHDPEAERLTKAQALWYLGKLWKSLYPQEGFHRFLGAYQLLTEIRSFSLFQEVAEEIASHYPDIEKHFILQGVEFLNQAPYWDEGRLNQLLPQAPGDHLCFWGFSHLNAIQVDGINALGKEKDVTIFTPRELLEQAKGSDWICWLDSQELEKVFIGERSIPKVSKVIEFPSGRLNQSLVQLKKQTPSDEYEVYFLKGQDQLFAQLEIPWSNRSFKLRFDLFIDLLQRYKERLLRVEISKGEILDWVSSEVKVLYQDFRAIKFLFSLRDAIQDWDRSLEEKLDEFSIHLVFEYLKFSLPRYAGIQYVQSESKKTCDLAIMSREYGSLFTSDQFRVPQLESYLKSLGPFPRAKLDLIHGKHTYFNNPDKIVFLVEQGLLKEDYELIEYLSFFEAKEDKLEIESSFKKQTLDAFQSKGHKLSYLSASRLQSFIDCPKKYALRYVEKLEEKILFEEALEANQLGSLEHLVIKAYCESYKEFSEENLQSLTQKTLKEYLSLEKIKLSAHDYLAHFIEIRDCARNGIQFFFSLKEQFPNIQWFFEWEISKNTKNRKGQIDLLGKSDERLFIFDFKRSAGSIPSQTSVSQYKKIQLLFYYHCFEVLKSREVFLGYLCLDDLEKSWYFSNSELEIKEGKRVLSRSEEAWLQSLDNYPDFESQLVAQIEKSESFEPQPIDSSACRFCSLKRTCSRGEILWN